MLGQGRKRRRTEFERAVLPYLSSLYNAGVRLAGNARDAEDLVQETILRAFRFFHRFEPGTNLKAWLFRILTNTFINVYRKRLRERDALGVPEGDAALERTALPEAWGNLPGPEETFFTGLLSDEVKHAVDELPVDFRMTVLLRDLEDFSYQEIADMMDCPVGTVMSRLYRGRRMLQQRLHAHAVREGYIAPEAPIRGEERKGVVVDIEDLRRRRTGREL
jgi:RNA polymerase sigma-70 factor (ECF subfamily)